MAHIKRHWCILVRLTRLVFMLHYHNKHKNTIKVSRSSHSEIILSA
jgi:hypothetical protein